MSPINTVREFVVENFLFGEGESLKDDTSFMEAGIIDSTGVLELIMFLEETYGIKIEDDELVPENFDNLQNVARYLGKKLDSQCAA
jgi:acyl carrier protein